MVRRHGIEWDSEGELEDAEFFAQLEKERKLQQRYRPDHEEPPDDEDE